MKSYLAKLAARATLADLPVSAPQTAPRISDPFENTSLAETPSTSVEVHRSIRPADETLPSLPSTTRFQAEALGSESREFESGSAGISQRRRAGPLSEAHLKEVEVDRVVQMRLTPPSDAFEAPTPMEQVVEQSRLPAVNQLMPTVEAPSTYPGNRIPDKPIDPQSAETLSGKGHLAAVQSEQAALLRRADKFMTRLFEHSQESADREIDADDGNRLVTSQRIRVKEPFRLQPNPPVARASEPLDERPQLVIGKLTVEVIPTNPAPVAPPQKVVVVRGARSVSTALPSGRRFGLGQF